MLHWKRLDTLLRAFSLLVPHAKDAHLTLIGHGPMEARWKALADDLNLFGSVTFLPSCPAAEVRRWMGASDVYVLPSSGYEGWGAVVNEAMAEGCVVVASSVIGSAMSVIREGQNGLLFRAGDYRQLAETLNRLYSEPERRLQIGSAGRRTILEEWSPGTAAARFLRVSEALLAGAPVPLFASGPMTRDEE
jgi:glycosyltransferase involved in cell wall biosynthesis